MEDVTSSTAELLQEGEELIGMWHKTSIIMTAADGVWTVCVAIAGDDSSNEGEGEEERDGENEDGVSEGLATVPEESGADEERNMEEEGEEEMEEKNAEESGDISFPDTTISLSHLQSNW